MFWGQLTPTFILDNVCNNAASGKVFVAVHLTEICTIFSYSSAFLPSFKLRSDFWGCAAVLWKDVTSFSLFHVRLFSHFLSLKVCGVSSVPLFLLVISTFSLCFCFSLLCCFFFCLFCFFFPPLPFCAFFPFCLRRFRYFFPSLDPPWAGSRCAQLLPPPSVLEQTCDSDYANPQQPQLFWQYTAQPLNPLPESDGLWKGLP